MTNRPIQLKIAIGLLMFVAFVTSVRGFISLKERIVSMTPGNYIHFWVFLFIIIFLMFFLIKKIYDGIVWARNTYIVIFALGLLNIPSLFQQTFVDASLLVTIILASCQLAGIFMLFGKENRIWFQGSKSKV